MSLRPFAALALGGITGAWALSYRLGQIAGSTLAERRRVLSGDDIVARPQIVTDHGVSIAAPQEDVWPWLVQMGWHRGGWYTARWVDRLLFPANDASADRIIPELQHLAVGDFVPDGPPESGTGFFVDALEPERHLVLHSRTHLPPGWAARFGAWIDWTWTFALTPLDDRGTRFLFRSRCRLGPRWLAIAYWIVIVPADFVMSRQMMRGLKTRAEMVGAAR
jgi:hypothetical protein